jgi:hypothetical protein
LKGVHLFRKRERHAERDNIVVVSSQAGDQEEEEEDRWREEGQRVKEKEEVAEEAVGR